MVEYKSERVKLQLKGIEYTLYAVCYKDGNYTVECESHDDPPPEVYDLGWSYFEDVGWFDRDGDGDFGDSV